MAEQQFQREKRIFYWMPKLDFYVVREFFIPFSVLVFAFTLLFLIGDVFNDVDHFLEKEGVAWDAVRYFALRIPGNIRFVLPITVLLSCMYTLANFGRHREITAMRASGISLFRCGLPIYVIAFCVMLVNFWFNETLIPDCTAKAHEIMLSLGEDKHDSANRQGDLVQYPSTDNMRNWVFGVFAEDGEQLDVRLKFFTEYTNDEGEISRRLRKQLDAKRAEYMPETGWVFFDCEVKEMAPNGLIIPKGTHAQVIVPHSEAPESPDMIIKAISDPEMLSAREIYLFLEENPTLVKRLRIVYETFFFRHLAFPWACFLCAFLALPLAAKNERSGIFTAIVSAVGVIVAYQIVSEIFLMMGKSGTLPPFIAGLLPTIAFAGYGIWLARKSG